MQTQKLSNAPLYYVIVQVRFNPVHTLNNYFPEIQEAMRRSGFPDAEQRLLSTVQMPTELPSDGKTPQVTVSQTPDFMFNNQDRTTGFQLSVNALSLQTTSYDRFASFSNIFLVGLETVQKHLDLAYVDRIGVRYLNAVIPDAGELLEEYLEGGVLGIAPKIEGTVYHAFSETFYRVEEINIRARTISRQGRVAFPPDLQHPLRMADKFASADGVHAVIDTDGYIDERRRFDMPAIKQRLDQVHVEITRAFHATATPGALQRWA